MSREVKVVPPSVTPLSYRVTHIVPAVHYRKTHVKEIVRPVEEVSAGLDDPDEGDDEEGHQLEHGADLAHPGGEVDVAALLPVEHLRDEARLEGDH